MDRTAHIASDGESEGSSDDARTGLGRREFVAAGLAAGGATLAGCSGLPGPLGGAGGTAYRNWVPASVGRTPTDSGAGGSSSTGQVVAYVDLEGLSAVAEADPDYGEFSYSTLFSAEAGGSRPNDPLLAPAGGVVVVAFSVGFGARAYPFVGPLLQSGPAISAGTPTPTPTPAGAATSTPGVGDTTADEWILAGGTFIAEGSVDTGAVVDAAGDGFSESGSVGSFTVYEASGSTSAAFAVKDDTVALALGEGGRATLDPALEARTGDGTRLHTRNDDVKWAFDTAGAGDVAFGAFPRTTDSESTTLPESARGASFVMSSMDLEPEEASATMAIAYESGSEAPARSDIQGRIGNTTSSTELSVDGDHVEVDGTWSA
jgi:hypothetical protein